MVGALVGLAIVILLIWWVLHKRKKQKLSKESEQIDYDHKARLRGEQPVELDHLRHRESRATMDTATTQQDRGAAAGHVNRPDTIDEEQTFG